MRLSPVAFLAAIVIVLSCVFNSCAGVAKSQGSPDLVVSAIYWIDAFGTVTETVTSGQSFTACVVVLNQGTGDASVPFDTALTMNGTSQGATTLSGLAAGAEVVLTWEGLYWSIPGSCAFYAVADSTDLVSERNKRIDAEANNARSDSMTIRLAEWTFAVYMCADNNLEARGVWNLLDMASVGSSPDVSIVTQVDRIWLKTDDDTRYGNWTTAKRFFITPGLEPYPESQLQDLGEVNMGSVGTLIDFGSWAFQRFGAERTSLVLWDHGSCVQGICTDTTSLGAKISVNGLRDALGGVAGAMGRPIDVLGFDACLMGSLEVFYNCRGSAVNMVGSAESEWSWSPPGYMWPYDLILSDLGANPHMLPEDLAATIVSDYDLESGILCWATMAAYRSDGVQAIASNLNDLATALIERLPFCRADVLEARNNTCDYEQMYWREEKVIADIYDFACEVKARIPDGEVQACCDALIGCYDSALISYACGDFYEPMNTKGLSLYWTEYAADLLSLGFETVCSFDMSVEYMWDEFLRAFWLTPGAPTGLAATPGPNAVELEWTAPAEDGGYPITDYYVYRGLSPDSLTYIGHTGEAGATSYMDSSAASGETYYYRVAAVNSVGAGESSAEAHAAPVPSVTLVISGGPQGGTNPPAGTYVYYSPEVVRLTAATWVYGGQFGYYLFLFWQIDGVQYAGSLQSVTMMSSHTAIAAYVYVWY